SHDNRDLLIVRGKEVSTQGGYHIIALAYGGQIHNFQSIEETLRTIKKQGGVSIIAHPFNVLSHGMGGKRLDSLMRDGRIRELVDAIEVFNANGFFPLFWNNKQAARFAD